MDGGRSAAMGVTARITGADQDDASEGKITFYHIAVHENDHHWTVHKRYNDFHCLDQRLQDTGELTTLRLPTKGLFGLRHRLDIFNFNEERLEGLNTYLLHLTRQVESLGQSPSLSAFLGAGVAPVERRSASVPRAGRSHHLQPSAPEPEARTESPQGRSSEPSQGPRLPHSPSCRLPLLSRPDRSLAFLEGPEWKRFEMSQPALADSMKRCSQLLTGTRFENDSEGIFISLRRNLRAAMRETKTNPSKEELDLAAIPGKDCVWEFLLQFAARRGFYRAQAAEVVGILEASQPWAQVLLEHAELRRLREEAL
mmetsp:Transcript_47889/g.143030  ORF Transcript_47889/g.143030 Transcript_47889/m.143030 type:complete len:312 (-) Transcript_47889:59-994(-)